MAAGFSVKVLRPDQDSTSNGVDLADAWIARASEIATFQGVNEGTVLSEEAHELGLETESWVIDPGMAPHLRDWVASARTKGIVEFYFSSETDAREFSASLVAEGHKAIVDEIPDQDWNAEWKKSFVGIDVPPFFSVVPPWRKEDPSFKPDYEVLWINPGAGFGTGTHETTRGCLEFLGHHADLKGKRVLDFGSGSGILAIAAAKRGAEVIAVEIDPLANDNARENSKLNGVEKLVTIQENLPGGKFDIILANILRPILEDFSERLCGLIAPHGVFIFSGLIEPDVEKVFAAYRKHVSILKTETKALNEWRAVQLNLK